MERLTKRQRKMLEKFDKAFPFGLKRKALIREFKGRKDFFELILGDLKLLEEKKLVSLSRGRNGDVILTITPKGKEKLRENFITKLFDSAYDNPLKAISVGIALISVILGLITFWR